MRMGLGTLIGVAALVALAPGCTWQWPEKRPEAQAEVRPGGAARVDVPPEPRISPQQEAFHKAYAGFVARNRDRCLDPEEEEGILEFLMSRVLTSEQLAPRYADLGVLQSCHGEYESALNSFDQALKLLPGCPEADEGRKHTRELMALAGKFSAQIPEGRVLVEADEFDGPDRRPMWAVLTARPRLGGIWHALYQDVHLSVLRDGSHGLRRVWASAELPDPRFDDHEGFIGLRQQVLDLGPDDAQGLALVTDSRGGDCSPSHVKVFQWRDGHMVEAFQVDSDYRLRVEDLNGDGLCEIINGYCIGRHMCHGKAPLWEDVYAYKGGRYTLANKDFPEEFAGRAHELRSTLGEFPDDPDIMRHLGIVHEIEGRPSEALAAYRDAIPGYQSEIRECRAWQCFELVERLTRDLQDTKARVKRLSGGK
jgi:tetratricopeptide (TPR) repeat protein